MNRWTLYSPRLSESERSPASQDGAGTTHTHSPSSPKPIFPSSSSNLKKHLKEHSEQDALRYPIHEVSHEGRRRSVGKCFSIGFVGVEGKIGVNRRNLGDGRVNLYQYESYALSTRNGGQRWTGHGYQA